MDFFKNTHHDGSEKFLSSKFRETFAKMEGSTESHYVANLSKDYVNYQDGLAVHIALFTYVQNIAELLDKSIQENATFVDAAVVGGLLVISLKLKNLNRKFLL